MPDFETDAERTYLITTIKIREGFETVRENFAQKNERSLSEVFTKRDYDKVFPIMQYPEKNNSITPKEAERLTGKAPSTTRRYLKMLMEAGYVVQKGSTNKIVYEKRRNQI